MSLVSSRKSSDLKVLVMGGGEGATAREVLKHGSVTHVDMVEIDGSVCEASKLHLPQMAVGLHPNKQFTLHIADIMTFLKNCPSNHFDIIVCDLSDGIEGDEDGGDGEAPARVCRTSEDWR